MRALEDLARLPRRTAAPRRIDFQEPAQASALQAVG
jgi:hypothetical protein